VIFACEEDMQAYVGWLKTDSKKYKVSVLVWVLMTNHVHLLCTPISASSISQMMQSLGRMYVSYFNRSYKRTGTIWEGRFKSCLVQEETYLMQVYRYIESNPLRVLMVDEPADYFWSSYQCNALGKKSDLLTPHSIYTRLKINEQARQLAYRGLFAQQIEGKVLEDIRKATNKGLALGNAHFFAEIESLSGQRVIERKRGSQSIGARTKVESML
jgi:putative transposase